jgi:hypothetical protein
MSSKFTNPDAIIKGENFYVCSMTLAGDEEIHQSDNSPERAERSVEILNQHEADNARRQKYYWRKK